MIPTRAEDVLPDPSPTGPVEVIDHSGQLARGIARDLGIDDWLWIEEAVRRRHRILFSRYDRVSPLEYELLRDSVEADLVAPPRA